MAHLLSSLNLRNVTLPNRIGLSPMCTFSATNGRVTDFHRRHYAERAEGCGVVMVEATAVEARGVIAPSDLGLWSEDHVDGLADLAGRIAATGAVPGIQLAHAGRKAGAYPTDDHGTLATDVIGPSPIPFDDGRPVPREMSDAEFAAVLTAFGEATDRAVRAGFKVIELHMAHGYLLSSFLSPIPNQRRDRYGGTTIAERAVFPLAVIDHVRSRLPSDTTLWARVSAIDPEPGGQTIADTITFAVMARAAGVDLIDCSAGGQTPRGWLKAKPGYQVKYAEAVRRGANVPTAAVGVITEAAQADAIIRDGRADLVLVGRALRDDPRWAARARDALSVPLSRCSGGGLGRGSSDGDVAGVDLRPPP